MSLNLFPARVPIGQFIDSDGRTVGVTSSPEFQRALAALFKRVGGANGSSNDDLAVFGAFDIVPPVPEKRGEESTFDIVATVAEMAKTIAALKAQVDTLSSNKAADAENAKSFHDAKAHAATYSWAHMGAAKQEQEVQRQIAIIPDYSAALAEINKVIRTLGTMATQNANSVAITGGNIDGTVIGGSASAAGSFTTVSASGQITSTVATGAPPMVIASTTVVTNLNASLLLGATWTAPGAIGSGTPSSGAFTTLSSTGAFSLLGGILRSAGSTDLQYKGASTAANAEAYFENTDSSLIIHASSSSGVAKSIKLCATGSSSAGAEVTTSGIKVGAFGANGATESGIINVTGSRSGNVALASLLTAMATYGLITDGTTA